MPPALQHDPALERLAFGGDHDTIVLTPGARIIFAPVQVEAGELQFIEGYEQVLRPLVTVATFPEAVVDKEIIKNWRSKHSVFSPQFADSRVSTFCQERCLLPLYSWRKSREFVGKFFDLGRITLLHLERQGPWSLISRSRTDPGHKDREDNSKTS